MDNTMDADKMEAMKSMICGCGSGKKFGECHYGQDCWCGSGKKAEVCCMAAPEAHGMPGGEK